MSLILHDINLISTPRQQPFGRWIRSLARLVMLGQCCRRHHGRLLPFRELNASIVDVVGGIHWSDHREHGIVDHIEPFHNLAVHLEDNIIVIEEGGSEEWEIVGVETYDGPIKSIDDGFVGSGGPNFDWVVHLGWCWPCSSDVSLKDYVSVCWSRCVLCYSVVVLPCIMNLHLDSIIRTCQTWLYTTP